MARFVPVRGARYSYHKTVNKTHVKGLTVSTVQFTNGMYETVIFNDSNTFYSDMAEVYYPGGYVIIDMQYPQFSKRDALRTHREFVTQLTRYA